MTINETIKVVGVTGTNGKTTVATLLYQLFKQLGHKVALLSTVEYIIDDKVLPARLTTPDRGELADLFAQMEKAGCEYCFMEVSSHGIDQGRIDDIHFAGAVFTNITQDHLDYHNTFEEYLAAKKKFFDRLDESAFALANFDDENGAFMLQSTSANKQFYGLQQEDGAVTGELNFEGKLLANTFDGIVMEVNTREVRSALVGRFNAYNLLAVYGAAYLLGIAEDDIAAALPSLTAVRGRFQYISDNGYFGVVDYAHTPDALENVLQTLHNLKSENQSIFTVVGCGGDRDPGKRPLMARIAHKYSDHVLLTSDNPRTENPETILDQMEAGLDDPKNDPKVTRESDRKAAIKRAVEIAETGDIILVAGKGHEDYQILGTEKIHFDDMEVLRDAMQAF